MDLDDEELEATRKMKGLNHMNNIEILEELIKYFERYEIVLNKKYKEAIENLIQEHKELKNKCNELNFKYTAQWVDDNFIPKSKVKELLEHYKNTGYNELEEVLQELLEEGE